MLSNTVDMLYATHVGHKRICKPCTCMQPNIYSNSLNILVIFFLTFKFSCFVTRSFRLTTYRQQILQWNNIPLFHFNEWNIDILILIFKIISMVMKRLQLNNLKKVSAVYMWQICYFVYLIELLHYLCCWVYIWSNIVYL